MNKCKKGSVPFQLSALQLHTRSSVTLLVKPLYSPPFPTIMGNKTEPEIGIIAGGASASSASYFAPGQSVKPEINSDLATKLIQEHFGVAVESLKELDGYYDVNYLAVVSFCLRTPAGSVIMCVFMDCVYAHFEGEFRRDKGKVCF